jgi:hypothetical protein
MGLSFSDANLTTGRVVHYICLVAVLLALPLSATAEQRRSNERRSDQRSDQNRSEQRQSGDRPSSGLSPLGLPPARQSPVPSWEQHQLPWWERQQVPAWERRQVPAWEQKNVARPQSDRDHDRRRSDSHRRSGRNDNPTIVYVVPPYRFFPNAIPTTTPYVVTPPPPAPVIAAPEPPPARAGFLRLDVEPKDAIQIYVDGVYVGTPADLGDEFDLAPGTRRIEVRARGYKTLIFDAEIAENRSITYRGSLERDTAAPQPPASPKPPVVVPTGSKVMYLIPGCYLGNVSPKEVVLPAGCDLSKLTTITP